jgi:hypothetical protein
VFKTFYCTRNISLVKDWGTSERFLKGYFEKTGPKNTWLRNILIICFCLRPESVPKTKTIFFLSKNRGTDKQCLTWWSADLWNPCQRTTIDKYQTWRPTISWEARSRTRVAHRRVTQEQWSKAVQQNLITRDRLSTRPYQQRPLTNKFDSW